MEWNLVRANPNPRQTLAGHHQIGDEALVDVEVPIGLTTIADGIGFLIVAGQ
jgi:hypothetical protein